MHSRCIESVDIHGIFVYPMIPTGSVEKLRFHAYPWIPGISKKSLHNYEFHGSPCITRMSLKLGFQVAVALDAVGQSASPRKMKPVSLSASMSDWEPRMPLTFQLASRTQRNSACTYNQNGLSSKAWAKNLSLHGWMEWTGFNLAEAGPAGIILSQNDCETIAPPRGALRILVK